MKYEYKQIKAPDFVRADIPWCRSIYVFAMDADVYPYPKEYFVCQSGLGKDYHIFINEILTDFAEKNISGRYEILCDKFIDEKRLAVCAGLGYICRNNIVFSDTLESFVNIGEIYSENDCDVLPVPKKIHPKCKDCHICENACPSGAIKDNIYLKEKCVSYLSQKKGDFTEEEKCLLGNSIYGCDVCRRVCPLDKYTYNSEDNGLSLDFLINMTNKEFNEIRNKFPFCWMGRKRISRNAKTVLENKNKSVRKKL